MSRKKNAFNDFLKVITKIEKKRLTKEFKEAIFNYLNEYVNFLSQFRETMIDLEKSLSRRPSEK